MTTAPGYVVGRSFGTITSTSMVHSWGYPVDNGTPITKYAWEVRNSVGDDPWNVTGALRAYGEVTAPTRTVTVTGLPRYKKLLIIVRAFNGAWGPWQHQSPSHGAALFSTPADPPTLSGTPPVESVARTSFVVPTATISDNGGQAPSRYRVQVNTTASDVGATVYEASTWTKVTVGGRAPLTTYYYRAAAYNSGGWGAYADPWREVTTLNAVPDDPAAPTISAIGDNGATVTWAHPALNGATLDGYLVRVCEGTDPEAYVASYETAPGTASLTASGLRPGTGHNAFVKALATPTDSGWSAPGAFTTTGDASTLWPFLNVGGVWKPVEVWARISGVWQRIELGLNVAGAWKKENL